MKNFLFFFLLSIGIILILIDFPKVQSMIGFDNPNAASKMDISLNVSIEPSHELNFGIFSLIPFAIGIIIKLKPRKKRSTRKQSKKKTILLFTSILNIIFYFPAFSQTSIPSGNVFGTWTQKANFGGTARVQSVGFSIGTKGYIGTGQDSTDYYQDFWEWNQTTNVWTQKANFGGVVRRLAVGFSIGTKGYIGTGYDGAAYKQDFWEWDQATNVWTPKADFGGTARYGAVGFSIGTKGYIGTGWDVAVTQDFWEWDQTTNIWTQKANFGGTARYLAAGFSSGTKGYIGTGYDGVNKQDFWEWDQSSNSWTQKANFGGTARNGAIGFSIGTKGYVGTGDDGAKKQDFWQWDQATNIWIQKSNFGGAARGFAVGFPIGNKGYLGTGNDGSVNYSDFWEYSPFTSIISGIIYKSDSITQINSGKVYLIFYDTIATQFTFVDSFQLNGSSGNYSFANINYGDYLILAKPDGSIYPNDIPTYFGDTIFWNGATVLTLSSDTSNINIRIKETIPLTGNGSMGGFIQYGIGSGKNGSDNSTPFGDPVPGVDIYIEQIPGGIKSHTQTDNNGFYSFSNMPIDNTYKLYVDIAGLTMASTYTVNLNENNTIISDLSYVIDTFSDGTAGIYIGYPLGSLELENNSDLKIYPNPNNGKFRIELNNQKNFSAIIYNCIGEKKEEIFFKNSVGEINMSEYSNGIYFLRINTENKTIFTKIIINK